MGSSSQTIRVRAAENMVIHFHIFTGTFWAVARLRSLQLYTILNAPRLRAMCGARIWSCYFDPGPG